MLIRKIQQPSSIPSNTINGSRVESNTGVYNCNYINRILPFEKNTYTKVIETTQNLTNGTTIAHGITGYTKIWIDLSNSFMISNEGLSYTFPIILYNGGQDKVCPYIDGNNLKFWCDTSWGTNWTKTIVIKYQKD